ncbi:terminase [Limnovirga soli]|uniref:Terminase n=1 Tax=Limnovirga soli TaxID=2656915 RepID=A0A8J8FAT8_9BACT|nr:terminase [Limnovirga soli]NNV54536.1 terminase [Limnovirga soli]
MAKITNDKKGRLNKKEMEAKKLIAEIMFMDFEDQNVIAESVGVTPKTISSWKQEGMWEKKRSAKTISRDELVNKLLTNINVMLDQAVADGADSNFGALADQLIKMTNSIEKLDKKNNVIYNAETFQNFNRYLLQRMNDDKNLTLDTIKIINKLQNDYITLRMTAG